MPKVMLVRLRKHPPKQVYVDRTTGPAHANLQDVECLQDFRARHPLAEFENPA